MTKVAAAVRQQRFEDTNDTPGRIKPLLDAMREKLDKVEALQNKKKILIVDDNAFIREMLARLLELEHFKVVTAEDGRHALTVIRVEHPDLVVTDFNMPYMDGAQLVKHLREQEDFRALPILVITAYGHLGAAQAMEAGADRTMIKPLEADLLIESINELLAQPLPPGAGPSAQSAA